MIPKEKGNFSLTIESPSNNVSSNSEELHVFDQISVFPKQVYLMPGCKTNFKVIGGPSQQLMKYYGYKLIVEEENIKGEFNTIESNIFSFTSTERSTGSISIKLMNVNTNKVES